MMKLVDAFWEKDNLGIETLEISCDVGDSPERLAETLKNLSCQYAVLKIPAGQPGLMRVAEENRFAFMETSIRVSRDLENPEACAKDNVRLGQTEYAPMDESDASELWSEFDKGIFSSDRVALDPRFSCAIANRRYKGWIKRELAGGAALYKLAHNGESVGFFAMKELGGSACSAFLTGLYRRAQKRGLGWAVVYFPLVEGKKRGARRHESRISLNNVPIFKLHERFGGKFDDFQYVYVRHYDI